MQRAVVIFVSAVALMLSGCGSPPAADVAYRAAVFVERPDVIVVRPFAATFEASKKDADKIPNWVLNARPQRQSPEDIKAGEAASDAISRQVVAELKARGLPAAHVSAAPATTARSAFITGQFVNAESATSSLRPAVGYRGGKAIESRVQLFQGSNFLGELKCNATESDVSTAGASIARQIADMIVDAYVMRGWLPPPAK